MKKIPLYLLLLIVTMGIGCPKNAPNKVVVDEIIKAFKTDFANDQIRYRCYVRGYDHKEPVNAAAPCKEDVAADKVLYASDAKRIRDDVTGRFIRVIDSNYEQFANDLQNRRATTNFLADISELGVGAAVGITNGERALQILGVALTAFRGGRKSLDQNFYERQSTPVLITKMDTSRDRVMSAILQKREKFGVDEYSLEDALGDVIKYFWAGTLTRAFVELSKDSSVQAKIAEEQLLEVQGVETNPIPSLKKQRVSNDIAAQRISLSNQFRDAEAIVDETKRSEGVKNVIEKFEAIWTAIEANDIFKEIVKELKDDNEYGKTIGMIHATDKQPDKKGLNRLFARFLQRVTEEDDKAANTKLGEAFLDILRKVNK